MFAPVSEIIYRGDTGFNERGGGGGGGLEEAKARGRVREGVV